MDYPMDGDDQGDTAVMNTSPLHNVSCPYRLHENTTSSASSQPVWAQAAQFQLGGPQMAPMNAIHQVASSPHTFNSAAYWVQQAQAMPQTPSAAQYNSHQLPRPSSSSSSEYSSPNNLNQAQGHNRNRSQPMDELRAAVAPDVFQSGQPRAREFQPNRPQAATNLTSRPSDASTASPTPQGQFFLGQPLQLNGSMPPTINGHFHPRQLPQPAFNQPQFQPGMQIRQFYNMHPSYAQPHTVPAQSDQPQWDTPTHHIANHIRSSEAARTQARDPTSSSPIPQYEDASEDDSEQDEDDEEEDEEEPEPPRARLSQRMAAVANGDPDAVAALNRAYAAETQRERLRAAQRARAHAVKMVASRAYVEGLEKVDLKTLSGDELSCIICYNEFGIANPDGQTEFAVRLKKCKHIFGQTCLKQWFEDSDSCPYCRDKVPTEPKLRKSVIGGADIEAQQERARFLAHQHRMHARAMERNAGERFADALGSMRGMVEDLRPGQQRYERDRYRIFNDHIIVQRQQMEVGSIDPYSTTSLTAAPSAAAGPFGYTAAGTARSVPQTETRRQARVRAANRRGSISLTSGNAVPSRQPNQPQPRTPMQQSGDLSGFSPDTPPNQTGHTNNNNNSAGGAPRGGTTAGQRSITPHPTGFDGFGGPGLGNVASATVTSTSALDPTVPPWNNMRQPGQPLPVIPNYPPGPQLHPRNQYAGIFRGPQYNLNPHIDSLLAGPRREPGWQPGDWDVEAYWAERTVSERENMLARQRQLMRQAYERDMQLYTEDAQLEQAQAQERARGQLQALARMESTRQMTREMVERRERGTREMQEGQQGMRGSASAGAEEMSLEEALEMEMPGEGEDVQMPDYSDGSSPWRA